MDHGVNIWYKYLGKEGEENSSKLFYSPLSMWREHELNGLNLPDALVRSSSKSKRWLTRST
jgi:hypothetical protein